MSSGQHWHYAGPNGPSSSTGGAASSSSNSRPQPQQHPVKPVSFYGFQQSVGMPGGHSSIPSNHGASSSRHVLQPLIPDLQQQLQQQYHSRPPVDMPHNAPRRFVDGRQLPQPMHDLQRPVARPQWNTLDDFTRALNGQPLHQPQQADAFWQPAPPPPRQVWQGQHSQLAVAAGYQSEDPFAPSYHRAPPQHHHAAALQPVHLQHSQPSSSNARLNAPSFSALEGWAREARQAHAQPARPSSSSSTLATAMDMPRLTKPAEQRIHTAAPETPSSSSYLASGPASSSPEARSVASGFGTYPGALDTPTAARTVDPAVLFGHSRQTTSDCASSAFDASSPDPLNLVSPGKSLSTAATSITSGSPLKRQNGASSAAVAKKRKVVAPLALPVTPTRSAEDCFIDVPVLSPPSREEFDRKGVRQLQSATPAPSPTRATHRSPARATHSSPLRKSVFTIAAEDDLYGDYDDDDDEEEFAEDLNLIPVTPHARSDRQQLTNKAMASLARHSSGVVKSSARRAPLQKLGDLMADLFEAEDSLPEPNVLRQCPAEAAPGMLSTTARRFFDVMEGAAIPKMSLLRCLLRIIWGCARGRNGQLLKNGSPVRHSGPSRLSELDQNDLSRLLRILERAVAVGDAVEPLPAVQSTPANRFNARRGKAKAPRRKRKPQPASDDEDEEEGDNEEEEEDAEDADMDEPAPQSEEADLVAFAERVDRISYSVLAADCCLGLLASDELPASLVSEDVLRPSLEVVKLGLDKVILPFVEACSSASVMNHALLDALVGRLAPTKKGRRSTKQTPQLDPVTSACSESLEALFRQSCSALSQLQKLVAVPSVTLSDPILISAAYAAFGPFFVAEPESANTGPAAETNKAIARGRQALLALGAGASALKSLRLPCLNLLRNIFTRHEDQRQWIVEEILSSLIRLPDIRKNRRQHTLRNGKAVHSVSALLLQLIQAATLDLARARSRTASPASPTRLQALVAGGQDDDGDGDLPVETWKKALEGPSQACKSIAQFLMQKVTSSAKVLKSSNETSYASILDILVADLQSTLFCPEWPASALMLSHLCRTFAAWLDDSKASVDARGVAIEHIGTIAAALRESEQACARRRDSSEGSSLLVGTQDGAEGAALLDAVNESYRSLLVYLSWARGDDQAADSAHAFLSAQWGCEFSTLLIRKLEALDTLQTDEDADADELHARKTFVAALNLSLTQMTSATSAVQSNANVFGPGTEFDYSGLIAASEEVAQSSTFMVRFDFLLQQILVALDTQVASVRTKAVRALSGISQVDAALLDHANIRSAVETRMSDESVLVREAAVALLGRYVLAKPELLSSHYAAIKERVFDSALAVRKRSLRLLAAAYGATDDDEIRVDACTNIINCIADDDTGMRDLAAVTIAQLWFDVELALDGRRGKEVAVMEEPAPSVATARAETPVAADGLVKVMTAVVARFGDRLTPLETVLAKIMEKSDASQTQAVVRRMRCVSDSLIDGLVDGGDKDRTASLDGMRTVHLIVASSPSVLSITRAKALLPYLRSAQSPDEWLVMELLLKIFRVTLPQMPGTAASFAESLQRAMTPLVSRPPRATSILQELIACYCVAIRSHTHDFKLLIKAFASCFGGLRAKARAIMKHTQPVSSADGNMMLQLMAMTALLCENADFDTIRLEHESTRRDIDAIERGNVAEAVFETLLDIHREAPPAFRTAALQSMGFLFRSFPTLMTREDTTEALTGIFDGGKPAERELLLKVMMEFFVVDQKRLSPEEAEKRARERGTRRNSPKKVDMRELVGSNETLADSGVSSALVQLYLEPVLRSAKEVDGPPGLQRSAMEILKFAVMQGLCHPLQCVPTLIALETLPDRYISGRALQLHEHLASKHGSILAARYLDFARDSFEFQSHVAGDVGGHRLGPDMQTPTALLAGWYSLVRDKRQQRLDFLRALCRAFDMGHKTTRRGVEDVRFARYIAENLATLEYKTAEELHLVIAELHTFLSVGGLQTLHHIDEELSDEELSDGSDGESEAEGYVSEREATMRNARAATIVGLVLLLRNHLKALYGLTEARCRNYVPGKKQSAGGERPATRRFVEPADVALDQARLPVRGDEFEGAGEARAQMRAVETLLREEGTIRELEEDNEDYEE